MMKKVESWAEVFVLLQIGLVSAAMISAGAAQVGRVDGVRPFTDADNDGWCDVWCAEFPEIDTGSLTNDANGDGTPDFFEMVADRDPYAIREQPPAPLPWDLIRQKEQSEAAKSEAVARARAALAPFVVDCLRDDQGHPISMEERDKAQLRKALEHSKQMRLEDRARRLRVQEFLDGPEGLMIAPERRKYLTDVVDGQPRFVTGLGHYQAQECLVNELWPGGFTGAELTGTGTAVAMWDLGPVDVSTVAGTPTHEQFDTGASLKAAPDRPSNTDRVINVLVAEGTAVDADEHATAVATAIVGAGDAMDSSPGSNNFPSTTGEARGMAYEAGLRVYPFQSWIVEMPKLAASALAVSVPPDPPVPPAEPIVPIDIVFSNHAYGTDCGWQRLRGAQQDDWLWHGVPIVSQLEDLKFGQYSGEARTVDETVHANLVFLPIWAAGNDSLNLSSPTVPEHDDLGPALNAAGGLVAVPHSVVGGQTFTNNPPSRYRDDRKENIIPEACAKNVLTVTDHRSGGGSSAGPTDDLRIKPDISAEGGRNFGASRDRCAFPGGGYQNIEGSSYAAAVVTGGLALTRQRWQEIHGVTGGVLASTWKALAIAAAYEGGIPRTEVGYGWFKATECLRLVEEDAEYSFGAPNSGARHSRIMEVTVRDGETVEIEIEVVESRPEVVVCWTDPPGPASAPTLNPNTKRLVNDIDAKVERVSGGLSFRPWALSGSTFDATASNGSFVDNDRDNVEVILIPQQPGTEPGSILKVILTAEGLLEGGEQRVSLVLDGARIIQTGFAVHALVLDGADTTLAWTSVPGRVYRVETSPDLETWTPLFGDIIASRHLTARTGIDATGFGNEHFFRVRRVQ